MCCIGVQKAGNIIMATLTAHINVVNLITLKIEENKYSNQNYNIFKNI